MRKQSRSPARGVARVDPGSPVKVGQRATFAIKADGLQFFDPDTGEAIWR